MSMQVLLICYYIFVSVIEICLSIVHGVHDVNARIIKCAYICSWA